VGKRGVAAGCGVKRREGKEMGREGKAGPRAFAAFFCFFFFPSLFPHLTIQTNLVEFEFKPSKLNTNKTMLQHECTSKLIL
jgi:hypothetical protein